MTIYVNLISDQLMPNAIHLLAETKDVEKVYLVQASRKLEAQTNTLLAFYNDKGIDHIEVFHCPDATDYYSLSHKARELFDQIRIHNPDSLICLNATGGTKPMSIAFIKAFDDLQGKNSIAVYTDSIHKKIITLDDSDKALNYPYSSVLSVFDYLSLSGFNVEENQELSDTTRNKVLKRKPLTLDLYRLSLEEPKAIGLLNALAQQTNFSSRKIPFNPTITLQKKIHGKLKHMITSAKDFGVIESFEDLSIIFSNEEAATYLGGGWLEEVAYIAAHEARIEHIEINVEGTYTNKRNQNENVKNELDVVLVNNNQMMIIEAKTLNWSIPGAQGKGQEVTLKLESLTNNLGGHFAKGMLLSTFPLNDSTRERIRNFNNLTCLDKTNYDNLVNQLKDWKDRTEH